MNTSNKTKLTLTVDRAILEKAKKISEEKHLPLSGLIENFLDFFSNPSVYCFECGTKFNTTEVEVCPKCGWMVCANCGICRCNLDEKTAVAVYYMRKVYEDLVSGRVK
jgi:hypothetical protein